MLYILGELSAILEKFSKVGLNDLKITFDLNCLTLPAELDYVSPRKPSMLRMFSNSSITQGSSSGSDVEDMMADRGSESVLYVPGLSIVYFHESKFHNVIIAMFLVFSYIFVLWYTHSLILFTFFQILVA